MVVKKWIYVAFLILFVAGCRPYPDLYMTIINATEMPIKICDGDKNAYCHNILSNDVWKYSIITEGLASDLPEDLRHLYLFQQSINEQVVKICDKKVPLRDMILPPITQELGNDKSRYFAVISQARYDQICGKASAIAKSGKG